MSLIPFILLFVVTATVICIFGYFQVAKPASMLDQLASSTAVKESPYQTNAALEEKGTTGIAGLLESLGRVLPYTPQGIAMIRKELIAAGYRASYAVYVLLGLKILSCVAFLALGFLVRGFIASSPFSLRMVPLVAAAFGYFLPGFLVSKLAERRKEAIRLALPDVLDLLVISTEAGCALDKAILNVSREFRTFHPAISEELSAVNMEMLAGGSRIQALRNFAERTGEGELKKLVAILIQTDKFGTSVADALRTQSEFMRVKRRQVAEEKAGKVGVKLVFPIFFFCMPALVVIVAGPGMLQMFKALPALTAMK
jgi:tight adherence protein C